MIDQGLSKYTFKGGADEREHWTACEKGKKPFIAIQRRGRRYAEVFYDVTNHKVCLETVSAAVEGIYKSYVELFSVPYPDIEYLFEQHYFFTLLVREEHAPHVAEFLHDYLLERFMRKN
jgi:hypothetical protein